jgi:two-component system, LuxR family, sensor kinase FixL
VPNLCPVPNRHRFCSEAIVIATGSSNRGVPNGTQHPNADNMGRFVDLPPEAVGGNRSPRREPPPGLVMPDCVVVCDERGCIKRFGPEAETVFGYRESQVLNRDVAWLMPSSGHATHNRLAAYHLTPGERDDTCAKRIVIGQRMDGGTFPMVVTIEQQRVRGERLLGLAIRDLTLVAARDRHRQELQAALIRAARIAELDHLALTLARTVTTPLAAGNDDRTTGYRAAALAAVAGRLSAIILGLRGHLAADAPVRSVESLLELIEAASGLALAGTPQTVTMTVQVTDAAEVVVDRDQIRQVLVHLIRDAMRAEVSSIDPKIEIVATNVGDMVEIGIAHAGPRTTHATRPHLFPGASNTAPSPFCRAIVEAHGGELRVEGNDAGGTVVRLTIPAVVESADTRYRPPPARPRDQPRP